MVTTKRPGAIRQQEAAAQTEQPMQTTQPVQQRDVIKQTTPTVSSSNRPGAVRNRAMVYNTNRSTQDIYKEAQLFYNAGDSKMGDQTLIDYSVQMGYKNSPYYKAQYAYWDADNGDEQKTLAAESDLLSMYDAVTDAVNKGYSDSWIKNNISAKNYAGLAALDNNTVLTRKLQYLGDETIDGMIYAARNPNSSAANDIFQSSIAYTWGVGNTYKMSYKSEAAKDPMSEIYHPYMQGNITGTKEAQDNTIAAKEQLAALQQACLDKLQKGYSVDTIYNMYFGNDLQGLDKGVGKEPAYPELYAMEYARQHQTAIPMSEDVDFAAPYFKEWLQEQDDNIKAAKGELDASRTAQYIARMTASFQENIPKDYQELVLDLYAQDTGIRAEEADAQSFAQLDTWLNENGLIGAEDFGKAYNEASARLVKKWGDSVKASEKFVPAEFISDGENADKETNDKQVAFRLGMKQYLSERIVTNADAKAFTEKYGWLMNSYDRTVLPGSMTSVPRGSRQKVVGAGKNRQDEVGPVLDPALDRLDAAKERGEITDEEYLNLYLEVASAYDNYLEVKAEKPKGNRAPQYPFSQYLNELGVENTLADKIDESIAVAKANYDENRAAEKIEVGKSFGDFERADARGEESAYDPKFAEIRSVQLDPSKITDVDYIGIHNRYEVALIPPDLNEKFGDNYDEQFWQLACYDTAERVNDIMRYAQYYDMTFTEAYQAMGFETKQELLDWLDECNYATQKKCADVVDATVAVFDALVASDEGTTASDLLKQGKISEETYTSFDRGIGEGEYAERVYNLADRTRNLNESGAAGPTSEGYELPEIYKDALRERNPKPGEAHGYSSSVWDVIKYGGQEGLLMHGNAWVMAALGFADLTPEELENKARWDCHNDPQEFRQKLVDGINQVDNADLRQYYMQELLSYQGDIFKFAFNPDSGIIALNNANRKLNEQRAALAEEMQDVLTPGAYKWANTFATATNSTMLSVEGIIITDALTAMGMTKAGAALMAQMLTTAPVEGGQIAYDLKQAGISGKAANMVGVLGGIATALSEYGLEGLVQKGMYKTPWTRAIENFGRIDTAANSMKIAAALTDRGMGKTATKLLTLGAKGLMGTMNIARNATVSAFFNSLQEVQQKATNEALMQGAAWLEGRNDLNFFDSYEGYVNEFTESFKSSLIQEASPISAGPEILNWARTAGAKKQFASETRSTITEMAARAQSEIGTAKNAQDAALADIKRATREREQAQDKLRATNIDALIDQESVMKVADAAVEIMNGELSQQMAALKEQDDAILTERMDALIQRDNARMRGLDYNDAVQQGDTSPEMLKALTETTDLVRELDTRIDSLLAQHEANDEQLAKLKEQKANVRQAAYDKARQEAIDEVSKEVLAEETAKAEAEVARAEEAENEAKAKHEAAKNRVQTAIKAYQEELKRFEAVTRAKAADMNAQSEDGDVISDGLVDIALGITDELNKIDVREAGARERSIKESLVKQMELSFPGFKVEFRNLGRGQKGKIVTEGGKGIIVLNRDATSFELFSGELGYELGRMAQIDQDGYKPLYDAVTTAVYGGAKGTQAAYNAALEQLLANGVTADPTQPNNAIDQASGEVFSFAMGKLLSGEYQNVNWAQMLTDKAPALANDMFDWIATRAKEGKALARHGGKKMRAQYNEIAKVLGMFSEALKRSTFENFQGQQEAIGTTPMVVEETTTDVTDFVESLISSQDASTRKRYTGKKRLPLFEQQSNGTFTIDRNQITGEENELINQVETAGLQAEYNSLIGEVTAESVAKEIGDATGTTIDLNAIREQQAAEQQKQPELKPLDTGIANRVNGQQTTEEQTATTEEAQTVAEEPAPAEQPAMPAPELSEAEREKMLTRLRKRREKLQRQQEKDSQALAIDENEHDSFDLQMIESGNRLQNGEMSQEEAIAEVQRLADERHKASVRLNNYEKKLADLDSQIDRLEHPEQPATATVAESAPVQAETVAEEEVAPATEETSTENADSITEETATEQPAEQQTEQAQPERLVNDDGQAARIAELEQRNAEIQEQIGQEEYNWRWYEGDAFFAADARLNRLQAELESNNAEINRLRGGNTATEESQTTEQDNAEQQTEQPIEQAAQPTAEQAVEQDNTTAQDKLVQALSSVLANLDQYDEAEQQKLLGKIRGIVNNVLKGDRSRSTNDVLNTPLAIIKKMMDNTGATMYQMAKKRGGGPAEVNSRAGYIQTKRLLTRDTNELIRAEGEHVMNVVEQSGATNDFKKADKATNIALFTEWMLRGFNGLRETYNYTTEQLNDFGEKLHLALINSKEGNAIFKALEEAHRNLEAYYNASATQQAQAYVREGPESKKVEGYTKWQKFKAYWTGADVYGDILDGLTNYATHVRQSMRYTPYAQSLSNMWIGDSDTTHGMVDVDHNLVPGAFTLHDGIMMAWDDDHTYFEQHKDEIWKKLNVFLALQSALDRYTPLKRTSVGKDGDVIVEETNRDPFSGMTARAQSEAAKFLGLAGPPTKASIQAAINEMSQDAHLVQAAENVRTWWRNIMQMAVSEGVLSQETYDQFQQDNPHYAPLQRDMSTIVKKGRHTNTAKISTQGDLVATNTGIQFRKAKGHSDRAILDPLQSFAEMAQVMGDKLSANRIAQEFAKAYDLAPYDTIGVFAGEISNGQARVLAKKGGADVLNVYYGDGTHRSFMVNNEQLLDLLQGKRPGDNTWMATRVIGKLTRFMASLTTTNNPFFAIRNAIRDYQTSVNYGSWATSYLSGLPKWIAAFAECLKYTHSKLYNDLVNDTNEGAASQQLADFLQRGGEGFMRKEMTRWRSENVHNAIMGEKFGVRLLGAGKHLITFNTINDAVEMASRYVEYKYGKNETDDTKGATDQSKFNAFMASREATVDFAQSGYGRWAQVARQVIPFFNATLQGWYRTGRMFTQAERGRFAQRFAKTSLNNLISGALSAFMCCFGGKVFGGDDDDWDEQANEYLKLTEDLKESFIIMPLSGFGFVGAKDFIRVPLLQDGLGKLWFNIGRDSVETAARAMRGEITTAGGFAKTVALDMLGVAWEVFSEPFTRDNIFIPTIDVMLNTTYYGSDLVNKSKMTYDDPSQWGSSTTPSIFFKMSGAVRSLLEYFGVGDPQSIKLLTSPAGLEYLTKEYTGVLGQLVIPALSRDKYTGEKQGLWAGIKKTVTGSFTLDAESSNDISSNFKDSVEYLTSIANLDENSKGIRPLSALLTSDERLDAKADAIELLGGDIKTIQNEVKELWRQYNETMSNPDLDETEKQRAAEEYRKQINLKEQEGINLINSYKERWAADMGVFGRLVDGWNATQQTLLDEGPGLHRNEPTATNPADLTEVQAGMLSAFDLGQTLPMEEGTQGQQTPATSPEYTGERVRGVTLPEEEEAPAGAVPEATAQPFLLNGRPVNEWVDTAPKARRSIIGTDVWNAALRETQANPSLMYTGTWGTEPKAAAALRNGVSATGVTKETAASTMQSQYQRGNVDLLNRPQVDTSKLKAAGWADAGEGTATVFSVMYTAGNGSDYDYNWGNNTILHMTPIKADGTVLSQAQLESYANSLLRNTTVESMLEADKPSNGGLGLMLWAQPVNGSLNSALKEGDRYDENLHNLQEAYYLGGNNTVSATQQRTTTTQTARPGTYSQATTTYNVSSRIADASQAYNILRKKGDTWCQRQIQTIYGDSLPQSYYTELAEYMKLDKNAGAALIATPASSWEMDGVTYEVKNYPGAYSDVLNWFADAYVDGYNALVNDPVYQNGTKEERLAMFKTVRTNANTVAKRQFVLNYVSADTRGIANNLDEVTMDVAMHASKEYSAKTNEKYIRDVYGSNLPDSWYQDFQTAWNTEKDTALLPFPSASVKVDNTSYYLTDYAGAQTDVMNWYADKYLTEYEKLTKSTAYVHGTQADRIAKLAALDSKANSYAMTNFKLKYLNII